MLIIAGIALTAKKENPPADGKGSLKTGIITLLVSTVGYVGYSFFPNFAESSGQTKFLPQAVGMATAAVVLSLLSRDGSRPWDKKIAAKPHRRRGVFFCRAHLPDVY